MIKLKKTFLLFSLFFALLLIGGCESCRFKIPLDYGESKWVSGEGEEIKIEMFVTSETSAYGFVTYKGVSKQYDYRFISETLYFCNIKDHGNIILDSEHFTGFSADITKTADGIIYCKMDLAEFEKDFLGTNELSGEYRFTLSMVKE